MFFHKLYDHNLYASWKSHHVNVKSWISHFSFAVLFVWRITTDHTPDTTRVNSSLYSILPFLVKCLKRIIEYQVDVSNSTFKLAEKGAPNDETKMGFLP